MDSPPSEQAAPSSKVQFTPTNEANVKIDVSSSSGPESPTIGHGKGHQERVGFTKEELMKYANQPFWTGFRSFLFAAFWVLWLSILVAAITIVWTSDSCKVSASAVPSEASNIVPIQDEIPTILP